MEKWWDDFHPLFGSTAIKVPQRVAWPLKALATYHPVTLHWTSLSSLKRIVYILTTHVNRENYTDYYPWLLWSTLRFIFGRKVSLARSILRSLQLFTENIGNYVEFITRIIQSFKTLKLNIEIIILTNETSFYIGNKK